MGKEKVWSRLKLSSRKKKRRAAKGSPPAVRPETETNGFAKPKDHQGEGVTVELWWENEAVQLIMGFLFWPTGPEKYERPVGSGGC